MISKRKVMKKRNEFKGNVIFVGRNTKLKM